MYFALAREIIRRHLCVDVAAVALASCLMFGQPSGPNDAKEVFERGQHALEAGRYADAEREFGRLLQMGVRSAPVYSNLGVAYLRAGKRAAAIRMLKEAKKLAPAMTGIDLNLGLAYYEQREFKTAAPYFAAVLSADPEISRGIISVASAIS
jgi:Flp pilus assembly protein TadD